MGNGSGKNPLSFGFDLEQGADPGFIFHFLLHCEKGCFSTFSCNFSKKN